MNQDRRPVLRQPKHTRHGTRTLTLDQLEDRLLLTACNDLPSHASLTGALTAVVDAGDSGGLNNEMWATVVNSDGLVCAVTFSGDNRGAQWPGSRVVSAQKANTANAFSLPEGAGGISGLALSTANLFAPVQPGGSLFGLQESNPVDTDVAYLGSPNAFGQRWDPMVGREIGGVNVFGGGIGLYDDEGELVGALGISGDTSCTDHIVAWKVRDALGLDHVPAGVSPTGDDNIIFDTTLDPATGHAVSAGGFGHAACGFGEEPIAEALPETHPIGEAAGAIAEADIADRTHLDNGRSELPRHDELRDALAAVVDAGDSAGLGNEMWATVVDRDGIVRAVVFSGEDREDQWAGSRIISAQKANAANAFSLPADSGGTPGLALSTANLYSPVQPGGSLFGLQESNRVDSDIAYRGHPLTYGQRYDPMVGQQIGGVNVFGGGLPLYDSDGEIVGAVGVSGDTSCTDHIIAWKLRDTLGLDHVPAGVSPTGDDNIIFDTTVDAATGHTVSASGFGHAPCGFGEEPIAATLPETHPIGDEAGNVPDVDAGRPGRGPIRVSRDLPRHEQLRNVLAAVVDAADSAGLGNDMWATIVDRNGIVRAVSFSGDDRGDQWGGSRVISAQKANTANAFSLPVSDGASGLALSSANLYAPTQPGGSLYGLQESNIVDTDAAYRGNPTNFGQRYDSLTGHQIGGVNVFGGGLPLYTSDGDFIGAIGVSGDTSCTDHIIAWKVRDAFNLDNVPAGVSPTGDDNLILDTTLDPVTGHVVSASGFGHPSCNFGEDEIINALPETHPIGGDSEFVAAHIDRPARTRFSAAELPGHDELRAALQGVVDTGGNGGLANDMWVTVVTRDGIVHNIAFSGDDRGDQWGGSRVISAQKANTANAFSLPAGSRGVAGLSLSTANLYAAVQPGGSLFGLQESNLVDTDAAYRGSATRHGQTNDPLRHHLVGGVNVFGGGLGLYNADGEIVGAIGVSGDTSCTDHIVAWKVRDALGLDHVPIGVSANGDDNIVFDTTLDPVTGHVVSTEGFGHPACGFGEEAIAEGLPETHPIGNAPPAIVMAALQTRDASLPVPILSVSNFPDSHEQRVPTSIPVVAQIRQLVRETRAQGLQPDDAFRLGVDLAISEWETGDLDSGEAELDVESV